MEQESGVSGGEGGVTKGGFIRSTARAQSGSVCCRKGHVPLRSHSKVAEMKRGRDDSDDDEESDYDHYSKYAKRMALVSSLDIADTPADNNSHSEISSMIDFDCLMNEDDDVDMQSFPVADISAQKMESSSSSSSSSPSPPEPTEEDYANDAGQTGGEMLLDATPLKFVVVEDSTSSIMHHDKLNLTQHKTSYRVEHNLRNVDILSIGSEIDAAFRNVVQPVLDGANANDMIGVTVQHEELQHGPIFLPYVRNDSFSSQTFTDRIYQVTQSNTEFLVDGVFSITMSVLKNTSGGMPVYTAVPALAEDARRRSKSLIEIKTTRNDCGHRAMYLAQYRRSNFYEKRLWKSLINHANLVNANLVNRVKQLIAEVNSTQAPHVIHFEREMDLHDIAAYARHLNITVVLHQLNDGQQSRNATLLSVVNKQDDIPPEKYLYLELLRYGADKTHYNVITSISGYLKSEKFCVTCMKGVWRSHKCGCNGCGQAVACIVTRKKKCLSCGTHCNSDACYDVHVTTDRCTSSWMCKLCEVSCVVRDKEKHRCLTYRCKDCQMTYTRSPHHCYLKPLPDKESEANIITVAFDIESMFKNVTNEAGVVEEHHIPVLLCAMIVCSKCYKQDNVRAQDFDGSYLPVKEGCCEDCMEYRKEFNGECCVKDFSEYVYDVLSPRAKQLKAKLRVFAHNLGSYDGRWILRDIVSRDIDSCKIVMQGNRILCIDIGNVRFQDSLNFFNCPLKSLPSTFKFDCRLHKGEFPWAMSTPENQNYVGPNPPINAYGYDRMKPADQEALRSYYETVKDRTDFNFQEEMLKYCRMDTEILLIAVQEFCKSFKEVAGFNCIETYFTLPSIAYATYRRKFLHPATIGLTPIADYSKSRIDSRLSNIWLDWVEENDPLIELAREQRIGTRYADGYHHEGHTIYEFNGCYFHGCPRCYPHDRDVPHDHLKRSPNELYEAYRQKCIYYEKLKQIREPLTVVAMWEKDFEDQASQICRSRSFRR